MNINSYLDKFNSVSLDEVKNVKLMHRMDQKFVFQINDLSDLLTKLHSSYNVLEVDGEKVQTYKTLYFDTKDKLFFLQHHNSRVNRNKVRFREYVGSGLVFLEVKLKNNKGKTIKTRKKVVAIVDDLSKDHQSYINQVVGEELDLIPQQWIFFNRITFVDKLYTERLTVDFNVEFSKKQKSGNFRNLVIAEIKTERSNVSSVFKSIAKEKHIIPTRFSKYCMTTIDLDSDVKYNRFKEKLLLLNKLKQL